MVGARARVLLAADHLLFVKALERLLESEVEVVGTAGDGRELLDAAEAAEPDVVVCEISISEADGLEATRRLVERNPEARVVVLGRHSDPDSVEAAFKAGARAYVVTHAAPEELIAAIREVLQGNYFLSPAVTGQLVDRLARAEGGRGRGSSSHRGPRLTPREREILGLVACGLRNSHIAERLCVSLSTVRSHLSHLYTKLRIASRVELALYAAGHGHARLGECTREAID